jgi:hypothetical protein
MKKNILKQHLYIALDKLEKQVLKELQKMKRNYNEDL